jgi:6-phosphofructo-2-kinase/fructose-2,6-biphosphatase 2
MSTMSTPPKGPGSPRLAASDPQLRSRDLDRVSNALVTLKDTTPSVTGTRSALIGAGGSLLRQFDESNPSKITSQSVTPRSVVGIGGKVEKPDYSEAKIILAMVGLPARGKSYLSNKLMRYLKWLEYDVKVFNVGQLRRSRANQKREQYVAISNMRELESDPA